MNKAKVYIADTPCYNARIIGIYRHGLESIAIVYWWLARPSWVKSLLIVLTVATGIVVVSVAPLSFILGVLGLITAAALAWVGPIWGVYAAILSVPIQQMVLLPGGTSFTQTTVVLMVGAWLLRTAVRPQTELVTGPLFWAWMGLICALLLATSVTAYSLAESLKATLRWVVAFMVWFVAVNSVTRRRHVVGLVICLVFAPLAEALYGLYQFVTGSGPPSFRIAENLPFVRAYGTIGQPNSFAGYMNMAWPLAVALCFGCALVFFQQKAQNIDITIRSTWIRRLIALTAVAVVMVAALAVSFSLGGWVGALFGVIALLVSLGRSWRIAAVAGLVVMILFLVFGGANLLPESIGGRISRLTGMLTLFDPATVNVTPANFSLVERMAQMKAGWLMFAAHPLLGVGPGTYALAYGDVASAPWYASRGHAHNFYLHMAAETGVIGLVAYLVLVGTALVLAVRALRAHQTVLGKSLAIGCCGVIAAVGGHNLFENLHVLNLGVQLSGIWAIVALLSHRSEPNVVAERA